MTVKHNSKLWINKEIYHLETEGKSVVIYDNSGNKVGTLNDLMFNGKVVEGVSFKTIKRTGVYNVKGLLDVPNEIPTDKRAILSVLALGSGSTPDTTLYKIIGSNGVISQCVATGTSFGTWSEGGATLENTIKSINNSIASLTTKLTTTNSNLSNVTSDLSSFHTKFDNHNHDTRYLLKSGDTVQGNLSVKYGSGYQFSRSNGQLVNTANLNSDDNFVLGDQSLSLSIQSKGDVKVNGHKIFTDANVGDGSGIDADKLDGIDSTTFLRNDKVNQVQQDFELENGHEIRVMPENKNSSDPYGRILGTSGGLVLGVKGVNVMGIYGTSVWTNKEIAINATGGSENRLKFATSAGDIGIYYNDGRSEMGVFDWGRGDWSMSFTTNGDNVVRIAKSPYINGRRLFLQNDTPSGDIPYGSVWIGF